METLENFKILFLDVWKDGVSGINISEIIIALTIFIFFLFLRGIFSKFVVKRLEKYVSKTTNLPVLADDSGLVVEALNGSPGVKSARFSRGISGLTRDEANNLKLLDCMSSFVNAKQRQAYFVSVVVGVSNYLDPFPAIGIGTWHGQISTHLSGDNGHGYDPIFYLKEYDCSSAQLDPKTKNKISHRGLALNDLLTEILLIE